mmetsp:Transcript_14681/g.41978  ORF Transcript_14681/g.41978 Transcript_14681/m.41978 type:complete len:261 (+) Transcript_14681:64-846(+)
MSHTVPLFWKLAVPDVGELRSWAKPELKPIEDLHVTLLYVGGKSDAEAAAMNGLSVEDFRLTRDAVQGVAGKEVNFTVTSVFTHEDIVVAEVALPADLPCTEATPHLTLCLRPGIKPVFAKQVIRDPGSCSVSEVIPPLCLRGVVCLQSGINERAVGPGDATFFEGTFLKVETNPRPSRQTEPSGIATLICAGDVLALAARLADSVKNRPVDPVSCKLKARVQAPGKPGHIYLKWAAVAGNMDATELGTILEARLRELMV